MNVLYGLVSPLVSGLQPWSRDVLNRAVRRGVRGAVVDFTAILIP
jgi:hypothetical protein